MLRRSSQKTTLDTCHDVRRKIEVFFCQLSEAIDPELAVEGQVQKLVLALFDDGLCVV